MTITTATPLGSTTSNRKWRCDVAAIPVAAAEPAWLRLRGLTEIKVNPGTSALTDTSDFEGDGFTQSEAFSAGWGAEGKVRRATETSTPDVYDPAQELVRIAGEGGLGIANRLMVRFYEMEADGPRVQAVTGFANATWSDDGGAVTAGSMASFTLVGAGKPTSRVHPDTIVVP